MLKETQVTDKDLIGLWNKARKSADPALWSQMMRGLLAPQTEEHHRWIWLREELRKRELYNVKHLG